MAVELEIDVVPFFKWLYMDGLLTTYEIQDLTGVGRKLVSELVTTLPGDPLFAFCENCYKRIPKNGKPCQCLIRKAKRLRRHTF
jgi:hypothetical protein